MHASKRYVIRRVIEIFPTIIFVLIFNFTLIHMAPGDPALMLTGEIGALDPEVMEAARIRWGLDKPLHVQLFIYLTRVLSGDLGRCYSRYAGWSVINVIMSRIPATLVLILTSGIIGISLGVLLGAFSAKKYGTRTDGTLQILTLVSYSVPIMFLGIVLIFIFSVTLAYFPISGMETIVFAERSLMERIPDIAWHLFLPATALGLFHTLPLYFRITRTSVLTVMREDFIICARSQGLGENTVFYKHALRNALLAPLTMAGIWLGFVLTGALMTETVFAWPGMGTLLYEALLNRDYPLCMGIFTVLAISVTFANLFIDLLYSYLDPRVTYH